MRRFLSLFGAMKYEDGPTGVDREPDSVPWAVLRRLAPKIQRPSGGMSGLPPGRVKWTETGAGIYEGIYGRRP